MESAIAAGNITPRNASLPPATAGAGGSGAEAVRKTTGLMRDARPPARTYYTGAALAVAAAAMLMAGFTSALVVRKGASNDWTPLALPRIFYVNTALLIASSALFEWVRRPRSGDSATVRNARRSWCYVGVVALGLAFLGGQAAALLQLASSGAVAATNPAVWFVYLFAVAHGALALGGLIAVAGVALKVNRDTDYARGRALVGAASLYWHWVGALWVYILVLLALEM